LSKSFIPRPDAISKRIAYTKPSISDLEVRYATDAARNGWGEACYEYIHRFERQLGEHLGVKHVIATSSCTGAIHLGLIAMGIGRGDEVILADTNWIATVAPVTYVGATPVFVDILPDTWCLDPQQVEAAITPRTKAIIATHLYGNLCDMDRLLEVGRNHGVAVIEDAAEALGSIWHGQCAGSMGIFGSFSFHGSKTITTGEGGAFVTNDSALYETALTLSNHGRVRGQTKQFWPEVVGVKYKMSNIEAAIGCAQVERLSELLAAKRAIFKHYEDAFRCLPVTMNPEPTGCINGYWMPTIVADERMVFSRDDLAKAFLDANIDARVFFWPLSQLPMFATSAKTPNSHSIAPRAMNLPTALDMGLPELERVCAVVSEYFRAL
jgi:perosamine synthetase